MNHQNQPDKITCDSYSDKTIKFNANGGTFSAFTNQLSQPLIDVKGVQLLRANFINNVLQLNDLSQLFFFYYKIPTPVNPPFTPADIHCVRLYPSNYVNAYGYTTFVKNKFYSTVQSLVDDLNFASSSNGDSVTYNSIFIPDDIEFFYDSQTRKISFKGSSEQYTYSPVAYDDPNLKTLLQTFAPTLNTPNGVVAQSIYPNITMNQRLGFGMSYTNRTPYWGALSRVGCASLTGIPTAGGLDFETRGIIGDCFPSLIGSQNINIYLNAVVGSGQDSKNSRNLLATIPVENYAQHVNSYTLNSIEQPLKSVAREIYTLTFNFEDDYGVPVLFNPNNNINVELKVSY